MLAYQSIKIFNKNGQEIPLLYSSNVIITNAESFDKITDEHVVLYPLTKNENGEVSIEDFYIKNGGIFDTNNIDALSLNVIVYNGYEYISYENALTINNLTPENFSNALYRLNNDNNESVKVYTLKTCNTADKFSVLEDIENLIYPGLIFYGNLDLGRVSAGLVECDTLILGNVKEVIKYENDSSTHKEISRHKELSFLDIGENDKLLFKVSNNDSHFKMFTYDKVSDFIITSNTYEFNKDNFNNTVNIAFSGTEEGVYEQDIFISLLSNDIECIIGQLHVTCECIGEDERYRALFENFGIQHPYSYFKIFKDTDINEDYPDWKFLNNKSKELFLSYDKIFPYVGTYKALINAVKYLGYDDIYFKEWFKLYNDKEERNEAVEINLENNKSFFDKKLNFGSLIKNDLEGFKRNKLNKLSLFFKINSANGKFDEYDIPEVDNEYNYSVDEVLIKLFALKNWLERNIIGTNCRIIDITGEGIVYERNAYTAYGNITQNILHEDSVEINPSIKNEREFLIDSSASIKLSSMINSKDANISIDDIKHLSIGNKNFINGTLEYPNVVNFYAKCTTTTDNYILDHDIVEGKKIWLNNGNLFFCQTNASYTENVLYNNEKLILNNEEVISTFKEKTYDYSKFKESPIIYLTHCNLKSENNDNWDTNNYAIRYSNSKNQYSVEKNNIIEKRSNNKILLKPNPNSDSEFIYTQNNIYRVPLFKLKNYSLYIKNDNNEYEKLYDLNDSYYFIEIIEGSIILANDNSSLDFYYDSELKQNRVVITKTYDKFNEYIPNKTDAYTIDVSNTSRNISYYNYEQYHDLSVDVTGKYDIMLYGYNDNGNVFAKPVNEKCNIEMTKPDIVILSKQQKNNERLLIPLSFYKDEDTYDSNNPYFRENYLINNIKFKKHDYIKYDNMSYALETAEPNDTINIFNLMDEFKYIENFKFTNVKTLHNKYIKNEKITLVIFNKLYNNKIAEYENITINDISTDVFSLSADINTRQEIINYIDNDKNNLIYFIPDFELEINASDILKISNKTLLKPKSENIDMFKIGDMIKLNYKIVRYKEAKNSKDKAAFGKYKIDTSGNISELPTAVVYFSDKEQPIYNPQIDFYVNDEIDALYRKLYSMSTDNVTYNSFGTYKIIDIKTINGEQYLELNINPNFEIYSVFKEARYRVDGSVNGYIPRYREDTSVFGVHYKDTPTISDGNETYFVDGASVSFLIYPAHQKFVKYNIPVKNADETEYDIILHTDPNYIYNYIDDSFSINVTKFDNNNAKSFWWDKFTNGEEFYKHKNKFIETTNDDRLIIYSEYSENAKVLTYWKLYKRDITNNTRKLLFEVLNNKLFLHINEPGLYDLVAHNYDKTGNLIVCEYPDLLHIK